MANIAEFLAYLKDNPSRLSYGSAGNGTGLHLAGEMFKRDEHPYDPAITDPSPDLHKIASRRLM